jgi:hypothetical protein
MAMLEVKERRNSWPVNLQVFNFVRLAELYYAGSHGMDIQGPTADSNHHLNTPSKVGLQYSSLSTSVSFYTCIYKP